MKKEEKKNKETTKEKAKNTKAIMTLAILIILVAIVIIVCIINRNSINFSRLLKKENAIFAKTNTQITSTDYPIENSTYINVTTDGIVYIYEDNGYPVGNENRKVTFISEQKIDVDDIDSLEFEILNATLVSPRDKSEDNGQVEYVDITLNGDTRTIYKKEFDELLTKYNIGI